MRSHRLLKILPETCMDCLKQLLMQNLAHAAEELQYFLGSSALVGFAEALGSSPGCGAGKATEACPALTQELLPCLQLFFAAYPM